MLLLLGLIPANLLALPDTVPAVTTMVTTVHGATPSFLQTGDHTFVLRVLRVAQELTTAVSCR